MRLLPDAPHSHGNPLPRPLLIGAALLIAFTVVGAGLTRGTGIGTVTLARAPAAETLVLRFEDRPDGALVARNAADGAGVAVYPAGEGHFVRGTLRGLVRERKRLGLGPEVPFHLVRGTDGRLTLDDPATGRHVDLDAFGATNAGTFAHLFNARSPGNTRERLAAMAGQGDPR
jgi:putative photosynthetic complex assembly protein